MPPLKRPGIAATLYSEVQADPPEAAVLDAVAAAKKAGADAIIGFGGGSSMDTAKLVALLVGTPQDLPDIYGIGLAKGPRLPLIQVPTTAGTGSEVTPISIVTTPTHEKKGVVSPLLYPDLAVLDAKLTVGLPPAVTAMTGIDAMVHAIEAYTSKHKKNVLSDGLAVKALQLLAGNMDKVLAQRGRPVGKGCDVAGVDAGRHGLRQCPGGGGSRPGLSAGRPFPRPARAEQRAGAGAGAGLQPPAAEELYGELAGAVLPGRRFESPAEAADAFIEAMTAMVARMPFAQRLRDVGVTEGNLDRLADDAMKVERLLVNNPREVTRADALAIYKAVF